jgi:hypothetical protein
MRFLHRINLLISITLTFFFAIDSKMLIKNEPHTQLQPGDTIQFFNTVFSFVIPKEWKHDWISNKTELVVTPPNLSPPAEFVKITVRSLAADEKNMIIEDLLLKQAKNIISISPIPIKLKPVIGPTEITLENFKAGKYVAEANPFGILKYEGFIGGVKDEENNKILFLSGAYTKKKSTTIRSGLDLILNSIKKKY